MRAISMIDEWKEICAIIEDERDEALSASKAEVLKTNQLKKELVSAQVRDHPSVSFLRLIFYLLMKNNYEAHVATMEREIKQLKDTVDNKTQVVKTLQKKVQGAISFVRFSS